MPSTQTSGQFDAVLSAMRDREWHSLWQISEVTGAPLQSVSARIRDMRKPRFGGLTVERRYVTNGIFEYRLGEPRT